MLRRFFYPLGGNALIHPRFRGILFAQPRRPARLRCSSRSIPAFRDIEKLRATRFYCSNPELFPVLPLTLGALLEDAVAERKSQRLEFRDKPAHRGAPRTLEMIPCSTFRIVSLSDVADRPISGVVQRVDGRGSQILFSFTRR